MKSYKCNIYLFSMTLTCSVCTRSWLGSVWRLLDRLLLGWEPLPDERAGHLPLPGHLHIGHSLDGCQVLRHQDSQHKGLDISMCQVRVELQLLPGFLGVAGEENWHRAGGRLAVKVVGRDGEPVHKFRLV
jgi:hypothetical protein